MSTNTTVVYPEYSPSWLVANFHSLPHIDFQGQPVSHTFNITSETNWDQPYKVVYLQSVLYLPWTIMFWCLMAMLAFFISLCCRVCSKYGCAPQFDTDKITDPKVLVKFYDTVTRLLRVFIAVVVIVIITDNCIYLGSHNLDVGYNMGQDALNFFFDMFNAMTDVGESLETEGVVIAQDVANAANGACPQAATMTSYIVDFNSDISSFVSLVSPMAGKVDDYHNFLTDFAVQAKNGVIYGYWAVVLMVVASFVMAMWFQSKCALKFNIVWVSMMLVFLWIVCVGEMTALMTLSDFCISPTQYSINLLPPGGDTRDIVSYYSTCSGVDPMAQYITGADEAIQIMNQTVNALLADQCVENQELLYVQGNLTLSQQYLNQIDYLSQCQPYYDETNDLLHNAVCFQLFTGFYIVWVCQFVISLGVFLLLVVSCILYQYFGTYWGMEKADLDTMVSHLEEGLMARGVRTVSANDGRSSQLRMLLFGAPAFASTGSSALPEDRHRDNQSTLTPNNSYVAPNISYNSSTVQPATTHTHTDVDVDVGSPIGGNNGIKMVSPCESTDDVIAGAFVVSTNPLQQNSK